MEEKEKVNDMDSIMELLKGVDLNRLRLLVEADKDGKCFISPVVVGQPVWFIRDPKRHPEDIIETVVDKIIYKHGGVYMKPWVQFDLRNGVQLDRKKRISESRRCCS